MKRMWNGFLDAAAVLPYLREGPAKLWTIYDILGTARVNGIDSETKFTTAYIAKLGVVGHVRVTGPQNLTVLGHLQA